MAFVSDLSGLPQVWTVSTDGGWPNRVTAIPEQVGRVLWSPDGAWLAFSAAPGGGMNSQVYVIRPDGSGLRRLTDGRQDNNWLGVWTPDSRSVAIASNRANVDAMDAYLVDIASGVHTLIARNQGVGDITDIHRDGQRAVLHRVASRSDSNLYLIDIPAGTELLLTPHTGPGNYTHGVIAPDGETVYLTTDQDRDRVAFGRVYATAFDGAIDVIAARDDADLETFALAPDGAVAALIWNVAGRSVLEFIDLRSGDRLPGPTLPAEIVSHVEFSSDGNRVALAITGSAHPQDVWIYDRKSHVLRQVTHSPHPGIDLKQLIQPELVHFAAHDGLELSGWLYRPASTPAPGPAVISFHGGPEGQERPIFKALFQALLAHGIAVFAPNVRGSGGFGKRFVNLDNGVLRFDAIRDIKTCADYLTDHGIAARDRVGIMGGSYGGYMTMAGLAHFPELFAAGANLFGVVNFRTFFAHTEPWMAAISKLKYGDPDTEGDLLDRLSPINRLHSVVAPTLVLHGANDTNVPVVEAQQVVDGLKTRGVPVEFVLFPDEGHGFRKEDNRIQSSVSIVDWFVRYLRR